MKLCYFDDYKLGVLKGNAVVDVSAVVSDIPHTGPGDLMNGLIERFEQYRPKIEAAVASGSGVPLASVKIRPPLPKPTNIECMAVNYMEDGTRSAPAPINAFHKSPSAIVGNGDTMVLPDEPATIFEGEAELAVIIGTGTNHGGLNPFMDGDKVEIETEGLGRLTFNIKDELKRKWERVTRKQMHERAAQKTPGNYPDFTPQTGGKHVKA